MSDIFPRTRMRRPGYRPDQVDEYFHDAHELYEGGSAAALDAERVRSTAFDIVRGGYDPAAVDQALDRLEKAFVKRRRQEFIDEHGRSAWMEQVAQLATTLYERLLRPETLRFAPARRNGYKCAEVDAFMDRIANYFDSSEPLTSREVRDVTFSRAHGDKAYDEASVDRYLARVVEVLMSVE
ncbi:DivIVA domain-containing protein [Actinomyces vulturis]|uniref:DivIVA domain-containing protein n=1 Tax=Actinomyces vulturis TaxID=1857645 RepID=UPI00082D5482|nr:DivIVA domain-containing protein [Actinomyces vulturis]